MNRDNPKFDILFTIETSDYLGNLSHNPKFEHFFTPQTSDYLDFHSKSKRKESRIHRQKRRRPNKEINNACIGNENEYIYACRNK